MGELTPRELTVLKMICNEKMNMEIAERLGLSLRQTEKIKAALHVKTKTHSNVGILKWAVKKGLYKLK